jgi:hypothetical protein
MTFIYWIIKQEEERPLGFTGKIKTTKFNKFYF